MDDLKIMAEKAHQNCVKILDILGDEFNEESIKRIQGSKKDESFRGFSSIIANFKFDTEKDCINVLVTESNIRACSIYYCFEKIQSICNQPPCNKIPFQFTNWDLVDKTEIEKDVIDPILTNEELYYAFDFISDVEVREILSSRAKRDFEILYMLYKSKDYENFMRKAQSLEIKLISSHLSDYLFSSQNFCTSYFQQVFKNIPLELKAIFNYMIFPPKLENLSSEVIKDYYRNSDFDGLIRFHLNGMSFYKTFIIKMIQFPDLPSFIVHEINMFWDKCKSLYDDVPTYELRYNKADIKLLFETIIECQLKSISMYIEGKKETIEKSEESLELDVKSESGILSDVKKNNDSKTKTSNFNKIKLGKSRLIKEECMYVHKDEQNDVYFRSLIILYNYLSGCLETQNNLLSKSCMQYIECGKNDFIYLLGGLLHDGECISDSPVINWKGEKKNEMQAFFYALYGSKEGDFRDLDPDPKKGEKKSCYLFNNKIIKLSENANNLEPLVNKWKKRIIECVKLAKIEVQLLDKN